MHFFGRGGAGLQFSLSNWHSISWAANTFVVVVVRLSNQLVSNKLDFYCINCLCLILIIEIHVTVHYGNLPSSWWCACDCKTLGAQWSRLYHNLDMKNRFRLTSPYKLTPFMPPVPLQRTFVNWMNRQCLWNKWCNWIMEELWKMFPEVAHCVKPPFKVLSIPAAKYWSPESFWRPKALLRIDRLCRFTLRCLDELSVPWYKTMTAISSIYVTWVVVMNIKIGFWAAIGKLQIN